MTTDGRSQLLAQEDLLPEDEQGARLAKGNAGLPAECVLGHGEP